LTSYALILNLHRSLSRQRTTVFRMQRYGIVFVHFIALNFPNKNCQILQQNPL